MTSYEQKQLRKSIYIPKCCRGEISNFEAAQKIGIAKVNVLKLKKRYREKGYLAFIRANRGHPPYNLKYDKTFEERIIYLHDTYYSDTPYRAFWRCLRDIEKISIPYNSLRNICKRRGIKSCKEYKTHKKPKHESRLERPCSGELVQLDASKHDWFMNGTYTNLHGGIDDARHIVTGLYFCDNECRLGYNEVLRQTFQNYGIMQAVYIDRHSSFVTTPKHKTLEERLEYEKNSDTHFNDICRRLKVEVILALSAEAKGRIERLWGTLQDNLPYIFRRLGICDNQSANEFLKDFLPRFNSEFQVPSRSQFTKWRKVPHSVNLDFLLSIRVPRRTDSYGVFLFHDHYFELQAPRKAHVHFILCMSEQFGIKAFMNNRFYDVQLCDVLSDTITHTMPEVEKDLISRYLLSDLRGKVV
jgi:transposase